MSKTIFKGLDDSIKNIRLIDIRILTTVWDYVKNNDNINDRDKRNYPKEISRRTNISTDSVYKTLDIFEKMDLIERKTNGRKNVIYLKVIQKDA